MGKPINIIINGTEIFLFENNIINNLNITDGELDQKVNEAMLEAVKKVEAGIPLKNPFADGSDMFKDGKSIGRSERLIWGDGGMPAFGYIPKSINELIKYAEEHSAAFANLVWEADLSDNPNNYVEFDDQSNTDSHGFTQSSHDDITAYKNDEFGCIHLIDQNDLSDNIQILTHELTNRINRTKWDEIKKQFLSDECTSIEAAYELLATEADGMANQLYVLAEMGWKTGDKTTDDYLDLIRNKKVTRQQVWDMEFKTYTPQRDWMIKNIEYMQRTISGLMKEKQQFLKK